ncbi:MAG: hypothetical protein GY757_11970 [bacterium]|nr:hypothetical protein [bacterium]
MENKARTHFDEIINAAKEILDNIKIEEDVSIKRALLKISGKYESFDVRITEIIDEKKRKYAYYLIDDGIVEYGCDNAADIKALKMKYGKEFIKHINEPIPHTHDRGKKNTELTDMMDAKEFLKKIKSVSDGPATRGWADPSNTVELSR